MNKLAGLNVVFWNNLWKRIWKVFVMFWLDYNFFSLIWLVFFSHWILFLVLIFLEALNEEFKKVFSKKFLMEFRAFQPFTQFLWINFTYFSLFKILLEFQLKIKFHFWVQIGNFCGASRVYAKISNSTWKKTFFCVFWCIEKLKAEKNTVLWKQKTKSW